MCFNSSPDEFVGCANRWYDFPARLLMHRPIRCRICKKRYFIWAGNPRFQKVVYINSSGKAAALHPAFERKDRLFSSLWTYYLACLSCVLLGAAFVEMQTDRALSRSAIQAITHLRDQVVGTLSPGSLRSGKRADQSPMLEKSQSSIHHENGDRILTEVR